MIYRGEGCPKYLGSPCIGECSLVAVPYMYRFDSEQLSNWVPNNEVR